MFSYLNLKPKPLLLVIVLIVLAQCTLRKPVPPPVLSGLEGSREEVSQILRALEARANSFSSFRSLSRSRVYEGEQRTSVRHAFVFTKPDKLRFDTFPLNGVYSLNLLLAAEGALVALAPPDKIAVIGETGKNFIDRTIGIPATLKDLMNLLVSSLSSDRLDQKEGEEFKVYIDKENQLAHLVKGNFALYVKISLESYAIQSMQLRDAKGERVLLAVNYENYEKLNNYTLAKTIKLDIPEEDLKFEFRLSNISINGTYPEKLFKITIPQNYRKIHR